MNKHNRILAAILAVQIVLLAITFWPRASAAGGGEPLFGELSADQVVRLTLQGAEGEPVVLAQNAGRWVLPEADDYPAQGDKIAALLDKLLAIRGDRLVARTGGSHQRLKVAGDDFERLITLELADGTQHQLYLGTSPRYQVLHVRPGDQDAVYLALGLTLYDARAEVTAWVDPVYFSVPRDEIVALTLENANGRFAFKKGEDDAWTMEGLSADETLNPNNVTSLVTRVTSLQMRRPLGREEQAAYGFDAPSAVVTVLTRDAEGGERTHILRVGAQRNEGKDAGYVVKSATSPYYVLAADYTVSNFVERTRQDFLELPPTPTPEPTVEPTPTP